MIFIKPLNEKSISKFNSCAEDFYLQTENGRYVIELWCFPIATTIKNTFVR